MQHLEQLDLAFPPKLGNGFISIARTTNIKLASPNLAREDCRDVAVGLWHLDTKCWTSGWNHSMWHFPHIPVCEVHLISHFTYLPLQTHGSQSPFSHLLSTLLNFVISSQFHFTNHCSGYKQCMSRACKRLQIQPNLIWICKAIAWCVVSRCWNLQPTWPVCFTIFVNCYRLLQFKCMPFQSLHNCFLPITTNTFQLHCV